MDADIARPSTSPWASPVVMVKKIDGPWRMCVDYRRVNKSAASPRRSNRRVRRRRRLFLARPGDGLSPGARCLLRHREDRVPHTRWPVRDAQDAIWPLKRAVNVPAPDVDCVAWYYRAHLTHLLRRRDRLFASPSQHLDDLCAVFERLRVAGLKLKHSKCQLFRDEVLYLGHVIINFGIAPDPSKLREIATWPIPETVRAVQSFLGFANWYYDFIPDTTRLTALLYAFAPGRKGTEQVALGTEELAVFNSLKRALYADPQLPHPDLNKQFIVQTDASKIPVGAVLLQTNDDGVERPISFCSKMLALPQQNYSTYERECLSVVAAARYFRVYLLGRPFVVRIDYRALTWLFSKEPKGSARVSGWVASLIKFPIVIE